MAQWLRQLPLQRVQDQSLVGELRSSCCVMQPKKIMMMAVYDLSMPVHSLLTRNDLQLICSQGQKPKGSFPPSLNRFLIDYQLQSGKATSLTCRKDAKYTEGQWSLLSHYLFPKFSSPRSQCAEVCANKDECSMLCIARSRLEAGSYFLTDSEPRELLSPLKLVSDSFPERKILPKRIILCSYSGKCE